MRLATYSPWNSLQRVHSDLDQLFNHWPNYDADDDSTNVFSTWMPSIDIKDEEERYVLTADVPGVNAKEIDITMENGVLTIQGERKTRMDDESKHYRRSERIQGKFYRRFSLPDTIDGEGIQAKSKDGVLEVIIPKQDKAKPKRITVSS